MSPSDCVKRMGRLLYRATVLLGRMQGAWQLLLASPLTREWAGGQLDMAVRVGEERSKESTWGSEVREGTKGKCPL